MTKCPYSECKLMFRCCCFKQIFVTIPLTDSDELITLTTRMMDSVCRNNQFHVPMCLSFYVF